MWVIQTIKNLAESVSEKEWFQVIQSQPKVFNHWLEHKSPKLAKLALNIASEMVDPQLLGMGVKVEELTDERLEISLPCRWKNKPLGGAMDSGVIVSLAEFSTRLLWERHIDSVRTRLELAELQLSCFKEMNEKVWAKPHLSLQEKDRVIFKVSSLGESEFSQVVPFYNEEGILMAQAQLEFKMHGDKVLAGKID